MDETDRRPPRVIAVAGLMVAAVAMPAWGQSAADVSHARKTDQGTGSGSTDANGVAGTVLIQPGQGGVAGTGLGKMPPAGDAPGTGQSVKGPPGQSIAPMGSKSP